MRHIAASLALLSLTALPCVAQEIAVPLAAPNGRIAEGFSAIMSVRELADGRVLVSDFRDQRISVADFRSGGARMVGRQGQGPEEYVRIMRLYPLAGDTTLIPDVATRRWLLAVGDSIRTTRSPGTDSSGVFAAVNEWAEAGIVAAADGLGNVLFRIKNAKRTGASESALKDSVAWSMASRRSGEVTPITSTRTFEYVRVTAFDSSRGSNVTRDALPAWAHEEGITACADGWIPVTRLNPYRVDWRAPNGTWTRGAAIPYRKVPVTEAEKDAYMKELVRRSGAPVRPSTTIAHWPAEVPPVATNEPLCTGDGLVAILRAASMTMPDNVYDIVDRRGTLVRRVVVPRTDKILAFGKQSVYTVHVDADGLNHLQRHPWSSR